MVWQARRLRVAKAGASRFVPSMSQHEAGDLAATAPGRSEVRPHFRPCARSTSGMPKPTTGTPGREGCPVAAPAAQGPMSTQGLSARARRIATTPLKQADQDHEKADKVDSAEECSRQAVTAVNQPHCDEKGHDNDNESEDWAEGLQNNVGGLDPTAVFELGKVRIQQLSSRTGNDSLPVLCMLDRLRRGRRHVRSPPTVVSCRQGAALSPGCCSSISVRRTPQEEGGASPR